MTDLTEQLEKGELPEDWYYLKVNEELANYPVIAECVLMSQFSYFYDFDEAKIEQVLAPVPSYNEWQAKLEENTKLKELLKECKENIASIDYDSPVLDREQSILLNKINQALGEDE